MTAPTPPPHVRAEMEGMEAVPDGGEPWVEQLKPPHPVHVARAAGALVTITSSRRHAYMIAYQLDAAGYLRTTPAEGEDEAKRCASCEHRFTMHTFEGCLQQIDHGPLDEPACCPCMVTSGVDYGAVGGQP